MTAQGSTRYVQPILISRTGTHEDAVRTAATASVAAYLAQPGQPTWAPWLARAFAKSVRRARPVELDKASDLAISSVRVGDSTALGFAPMDYDSMPKAISNTQVSGTDYERAGWPTATGPGPLLLINASLNMTTGKTAAQAAHALFVWMLRLPAPDRDTWHLNGLPFHIRDANPTEFLRVARNNPYTIHDSGYTEIAPNTPTVTVATSPTS